MHVKKDTDDWRDNHANIPSGAGVHKHTLLFISFFFLYWKMHCLTQNTDIVFAQNTFILVMKSIFKYDVAEVEESSELEFTGHLYF